MNSKLILCAVSAFLAASCFCGAWWAGSYLSEIDSHGPDYWDTVGKIFISSFFVFAGLALWFFYKFLVLLKLKEIEKTENI